EAEPEFRRLDLTRVRRADGVDRVGPDDTSFQKTEPAVEFEPFRIIERRIEPEIGDRRGGENFPDPEVVNRKHALRAEKRWIAREARSEIAGEQSGLPVVRVKYVRPEDISRDTQRGLIQKPEADVIVRVIDIVFVVNPGPIV